MVDWDKLRIFHAVAEAGSFTHAGQMLNLSQSAVSRQISALEESLEVSLFHRHARGLLLTEQGEMLQTAAKDIFGKMATIESRIADSKHKPEGSLRITTTAFIGATWIAPYLSSIRKEHPKLQMTLLLDNRIYNLGMREADAAIRLYKPEQPDLIQMKLATMSFRIYASKGYLEEHGEPKTMSSLREHTLIGYPDNMPAPFSEPNWIFRLADIHPENHPAALMMNSMGAIHRAVKEGVGLAMLPDYIAYGDDDLQRVLPDKQPHGVDMYFVYPEERRHSSRIKIFREFLQKRVSETVF